MFWFRGMFLLAFALFIDGLQAALAWSAFALGSGLQAITPWGGAAGGAAAGAVLCWDSANGVLTAVVDATKCALGGGALGALASGFGAPLGIGLGFALEICVSFTFGFGLIILLYYYDLYDNTRMLGAGLVEIVPGVNNLPAWTLMVVLCLFKKYSEEKLKGVTGASVDTKKVIGVAENLVAGGPFGIMRAVSQANKVVEEGRRQNPQPQLQQIATSIKPPTINSGINKDVRPYVEKIA
jgi:hypothetical protein